MTKHQLLKLLENVPSDAEVMLNCWPSEPSTVDFSHEGPGIDDLFHIDEVEIHDEEPHLYKPFVVFNARVEYVRQPNLKVVK